MLLRDVQRLLLWLQGLLEMLLVVIGLLLLLLQRRKIRRRSHWKRMSHCYYKDEAVAEEV